MMCNGCAAWHPRRLRKHVDARLELHRSYNKLRTYNCGVQSVLLHSLVCRTRPTNCRLALQWWWSILAHLSTCSTAALPVQRWLWGWRPASC